MERAKYGKKVKVHFFCRLDDGTVVGNTMNQKPLQFTLGKGQVIAGFEEAVEGMEQGQTKDVTIPIDKAFGPYDEKMVKVVDKNILPADQKINAGSKLRAKDTAGNTIDIRVIDVSEETATLDFNHPLAGKELFLKVNVVEIS